MARTIEIDVQAFTRDDGTQVSAHKRTIAVTELSGENRVKLDNFLQRIGRGTSDFNPVDTAQEADTLESIIGDAVANVRPASPLEQQIDIEGSQEILLDLLNGDLENFDEVVGVIADEEGLTKQQVNQLLLDSGYRFGDGPIDREHSHRSPEGGFDIESDNFKRWSRGYEYYENGGTINHFGKTGEPFVAKVFHGTTQDFYEFKGGERGNVRGFLGAQNYFTTDYHDASRNYAGLGPDLEGRVLEMSDMISADIQWDMDSGITIDDEYLKNTYGVTKSDLDSGTDFEDAEDIAGSIANKKLVGDSEKVMELVVRADNPIFINATLQGFRGDQEVGQNKKRESISNDVDISEEELDDAWDVVKSDNDLTDEDREDWSWDIRSQAMNSSYLEPPIVEALREALYNNGYDGERTYEFLGDAAFETELNSMALSNIRKNMRNGLYENDLGERAIDQVFAETLFNLGFDAVILRDADAQFPGMNMNQNTAHIHLPDEHNNQIKLADGSNVQFLENSNIRNQVSSFDKTFREFSKGSKFESMSLKEILSTPEGQQFHGRYISLWRRNLS